MTIGVDLGDVDSGSGNCKVPGCLWLTKYKGTGVYAAVRDAKGKPDRSMNVTDLTGGIRRVECQCRCCVCRTTSAHNGARAGRCWIAE